MMAVLTDPLGDMQMSSARPRIVTNPILRDANIERRIIELNREKIIYTMLIIGSVLILVAIMW